MEGGESQKNSSGYSKSTNEPSDNDICREQELELDTVTREQELEIGVDDHPIFKVFEKLADATNLVKQQEACEIMFNELAGIIRNCGEPTAVVVEKCEEEQQKFIAAKFKKWEAQLRQKLEQREDGPELSSFLSKLVSDAESIVNKGFIQLLRVSLGLEEAQDNLSQEFAPFYRNFDWKSEFEKNLLGTSDKLLELDESRPQDMLKDGDSEEQLIKLSKLSDIMVSEIYLEQYTRMMESLNKASDIVKQRATRLLDEAMEKGYVTSQHIVLVLTGIAGSGKSSFKRVVLDLPPAEVRVSTPLAEAAVRNISISRATVTGADSVEWEMVTSEKLLEMVAEEVKKGGETQKASLPPFMLAFIEAFNSTCQPDKTSQGDDYSANMSTSQAHTEHTSNLSTPQDKDNTAYITAQDSKRENCHTASYDPLLKLIIMSKGSRRLLGVRWVYIIDTGGQPQFLQLLPAFLKHISACVSVVRLDQNLDHKPLIQFFDESGKQCGDSQLSERTNLQVIESCLRTIHTQCCLGSNSSPSCFVVGTHLDEYEKHPHLESVEQKNEKLVTRLNPLLEKCLTFYKSGEEFDELIFPLNCKTPEQRDKEVAAEFRKCIMSQSHEPEGKIPLAWFVLEERIRQYAAEKNIPYVEKDVCAKIAKRLEICAEEFEAAVDHLLRLNIFHCYPSLPNLIFCDRQVVLLKLTELVQYCFYLNTTAIGIGGEDLSFKNEGIITLELLSNPRFSRFYSELFTPQNLLDILLSLLAVAHLRDEKYFMPCLLKELSEKEVNTHRTTSRSLAPLLLYIDDKSCLPNGLFASLIASLKNNHGWRLAYQRGHRPKCLHQNCITFTLPGGIPGSVTLIESFSYLEIHLTCSMETKVDKTCGKIFKDIKTGLEESWRVLYSNTGEISPRLAFFCSSCPSSLPPDLPPEARDHYATVSSCGEYETCSLIPTQGAVLCESKLRWLKNTDYNQDPESSSANIKSSGVASDLHTILSSLPAAATSCLDKGLDWDNDYDRDLITIAEHLLEWEELLAKPFQLTPTQISDIKSIYNNQPTLQRRAVLETWKFKSALQATYRHLLQTLVEAKHMRGARAVCDVLKNISTTSRGKP